MVNNQPHICYLSNVMIQSKWKISFKKLNIENSTNLSLNPKTSKVVFSTQDGAVYLCSLYNQSFNLNFNPNDQQKANENSMQIFEPGNEVVHLFWLNDFTQLCAIKRGGQLFIWNAEDNSSFATRIRELIDVESLEFDNKTKTLLCINGRCLINIAFCTLAPPLCLTSSSLFLISTGKMIASIHKISSSQFDDILTLPPEIFPISMAVESAESDLAIYGGNCLVTITENKLFLKKLSDLTAMCWCNRKLYAFCTSSSNNKLSSSTLTIFSKELSNVGSISSPHLASTVSASPKNDRIVISNRHYLTVFDFDPNKTISRPPSLKFMESHIGWEEFTLTVTTFTVSEAIINAICGSNDDVWLHLKTRTNAGSNVDLYNFDYSKTINKRNEKKTSNEITENVNIIIDMNDDNSKSSNIDISKAKSSNVFISTVTSGNIEINHAKSSNIDLSNIDIDKSNQSTDDKYNYDNIIVSFPSYNVIETNADKMWTQSKLQLLFIEKSNTVTIYRYLSSELFSFDLSYNNESSNNQISRKSDKPLCSMNSDFIFLMKNFVFGIFPFTSFDFAFRIMKDELVENERRCFAFADSLTNLSEFNQLMSQLCIFSLQKGNIVEYVKFMKMFDSKEILKILSNFDKNVLAVLASTLTIDNENFIEISELFGSFDTDLQIQILTTSDPSDFIKIIQNNDYKKRFFKNSNINYLSKIVDSLIMSMEWSKLERFYNVLLEIQIDIDLPSKLMSFNELGTLQFGQTLKIIEKDNVKWSNEKVKSVTFSNNLANQNELLKNLGFAFTAADFGQWAAACFSVTGDKSKCKFIFQDKPEIIKDVDKFVNDENNNDQKQIISFLRNIINEIDTSDF